jgi:glycyl-tRNA synthetase (class II)
MTKPSGKEFWDNPKDPRHGTVNGYSNLMCSCDHCREAWRVAHLAYMHRDDNLERHADRQHAYRGVERTRPYTPRPHTRKEVDA